MSEPPSSVAMTGVGAGSSTIRKGPSTKKAIRWRRDNVLELMSKGVVRLSHLSQQMQVSEATIKRDKRWLARQLYKELGSYETNTLVFNLINQGTFKLIEKAWEIVESAKDDNIRIQAMRVIAANYHIICKLTHSIPVIRQAAKELEK
jgi:hypothetical protein